MKASVAPHGARLAALRAELARAELGGFLVPRSDEQLGEYIPACAQRLGWLTGFTGSAGMAVVLDSGAAIFSDGRYSIQVAMETDGDLFERHHILETPSAVWTARRLKGGCIGYDPRLFSEDGLAPFVEAGIDLRAVDVNPIDVVWSDRPEPSMAPLAVHPLEFAGRTSGDKRAEIGAALRDAAQDCAVITDSTSLAWLLNVRGNDVKHLPGVVGSALIDCEGKVDLFVPPEKIPSEVAAWLGNAVSVRPPAEMEGALRALSGKTVRVDRGGSPIWFFRHLREAGAVVVPGADPCLLPKACKNEVEREGLRAAHLRDGVAMAKFLCHMAEAGPGGHETEISAADRLVAFRAEFPEFRGESFQAISAAGEHAALNHYKVTPQSNRRIAPDELYLIDSGGQYLDGTTDVTRTIWTGNGPPPDHLREIYTRVLKGLVSLQTLTFPHGTAGVHIDAFARRSLWEAGLDYDHGTGHGVGCYLAVHEGPASISKPLRPALLEAGMLMANEPGYYVPGAFGVRLENLMFVVEAGLPGTRVPFLKFDQITLAPFERRMIDKGLLSPAEIEWLDAYHACVCAALAPRLAGREREWLVAACRPLSG